MSLTADQITAKNFEEYHKRILPFLNGSFPTPIVNKFSKGDLYSTDEKIVGQWIDGKPVYQKTVDCGALPNNTEKTVNHGILNIDKIILVLGIGLFSNGTSMPLPLVYNSSEVTFTTKIAVNKTQIVMSNNADRSNVNGYVTIQYTKTTDSPISIGDGNDYSTDEQVVGTWIDGKPVYQKTVEFGSIAKNQVNYQVSCGLSNVDDVIDLTVVVYADDNNFTTLPMMVAKSTTYGIDTQGYYKATDKVRIDTAENSVQFGFLTIQYTKTTD